MPEPNVKRIPPEGLCLIMFENGQRMVGRREGSKFVEVCEMTPWPTPAGIELASTPIGEWTPHKFGESFAQESGLRHEIFPLSAESEYSTTWMEIMMPVPALVGDTIPMRRTPRP